MTVLIFSLSSDDAFDKNSSTWGWGNTWRISTISSSSKFEIISIRSSESIFNRSSCWISSWSSVSISPSSSWSRSDHIIFSDMEVMTLSHALFQMDSLHQAEAWSDLLKKTYQFHLRRLISSLDSSDDELVSFI